MTTWVSCHNCGMPTVPDGMACSKCMQELLAEPLPNFDAPRSKSNPYGYDPWWEFPGVQSRIQMWLRCAPLDSWRYRTWRMYDDWRERRADKARLRRRLRPLKPFRPNAV